MQQSVSALDTRDLQRRSDRAGLSRLALHGGLLASGGLVMMGAPAPWWTLGFVVYALALVFLFAPLHECIHRTAFRRRGLNEVCANVCGFLLLLPPRYFRCFHLAHHRHTQIPGADPELAAAAPTTLGEYAWRLSGLPYWGERLATLARHVRGVVDEPFVAPGLRAAVVREARLFVGGYALALVAALSGAAQPLLVYWWLPALCGMPALRAYLLAEHTGCAFDPAMHRNSRTLRSNRLLRLLAWNMPYHTAHHCQPAVPFHALPRLHARLQPAPLVQSPGYLQFHCELVARLRRRELPTG